MRTPKSNGTRATVSTSHCCQDIELTWSSPAPSSATFLGGLGTTVGNTFSGAGSTVGNTMSGLGSTAGSAAQGVGQTVSGASEGLGQAAKGLGNSVNKAVGTEKKPGE